MVGNLYRQLTAVASVRSGAWSHQDLCLTKVGNILRQRLYPMKGLVLVLRQELLSSTMNVEALRRPYVLVGA